MYRAQGRHNRTLTLIAPVRCEKTKRNFGSFVALAAAFILVKFVHTA
jgi:hypothetical protein